MTVANIGHKIYNKRQKPSDRVAINKHWHFRHKINAIKCNSEQKNII